MISTKPEYAVEVNGLNKIYSGSPKQAPKEALKDINLKIPVGSFFGLTSLTYVITGYLSGFLYGKYYKMIPTYYHLTWLGIILFHFFIYSFIRYQDLFETTMTVFWLKWILTSGYTLGFLAIFQMIIPLQQED